MSALRTVAVLLVVLGLAVLVIVSGLGRVDALREQRRADLLRLVEQDLQRAARTVGVLLSHGIEADAPAVRGILRDTAPLPGLAFALVGPGATPSDGNALRFTAPVDGDPPRLLVASIPDVALDAALEPADAGATWVIGTTVAAVVVLAVVGVVVLRLSQRTFRLQETERYLRWIRRVTDRYRALMEGAADLILILEPDTGEVREANAVARAALGLPEHALPGPDALAPAVGAADLVATLQPGSVERYEAALRRAHDGAPVFERGLQLRAADGALLTVDAQFALIDLGDERVVELSLRDVTHQRDMERQLQTSERLASLGLLTAGVAHEINNPLEGVGNYLALLEGRGLEPEKHARYLGQVRRGFDRIRDIVRDLLSFARPSMESSRADLREVVDGALGLAGYASEFRDIRVVRDGLDEPLPVAGDARRLEQVVLNLVLNASQAVGGAGTVRISGARVTADDGTPAARLVLSDDGPGIPPEDLDRLFDPFFSGRGGTGLGLSVSFGIVAAHGGTLTARNLPAGGAEFTLTLPVVPAGEAAP